MKHIKNFITFEAVILPSKIEDDAPVNSFESAVEFGQRNGFDVVNYNDFYNSLSEGDKKAAPPKAIPFFALFHPENNKPMFVLTDENIVRYLANFKQIMLDIIGHERVHQEQTRRRNADIEYSLPSPLDRKAYLSNKEEVMAFSFTIANELSKMVKSPTEGMQRLERGVGGQAGQIWLEVKNNCDEKTIKRYRKYIYMYLDKIFND